jgi:hypothetical protein
MNARNKALIVGGVIGASPGETLKLGLGILALLRQIAGLRE